MQEKKSGQKMRKNDYVDVNNEIINDRWSSKALIQGHSCIFISWGLNNGSLLDNILKHIENILYKRLK